MTSPTSRAVVDLHSGAPAGKPCEACGTPVEPLDKFCPACGTPNPDFRQPIQARSASEGPRTDFAFRQEDVIAQRFFRCQQCGAEVATDPHQRSYVCPFCDST